MSSIDNIQIVLDFIMEALAVSSIFFFTFAFVSQYPAYCRREKQAKTLQRCSFKDLAVDAKLTQSASNGNELRSQFEQSIADFCGIELLTWITEPTLCVAQQNRKWWAAQLWEITENDNRDGSLVTIETEVKQLALPASAEVEHANYTQQPKLKKTVKKSRQTKEGKKKKQKREKQSSVVVMEKDVQVYQLRGQQMVMVDDLPFSISETVKTYQLRGKSAIYLLIAQEIANENDAAKEVKKAA